jgi:hypothetical protein
MEKKLTESQVRVFVALAEQKAKVQQEFERILEAEQEQVELLRAAFGFPDGEYTLRQSDDGVMLLKVEED